MCRALLERLAVEEPQADAEPETVRARLVVNLVEPAAERLLRQLLARRRRSGESSDTVQLDVVRSQARERMGGGEEAAMQLVRWITQWTPTMTDPEPDTVPVPPRRHAVATASGASPDDIDALIARVKERGFVTTGEIFAALPDLEPETAELAAIYTGMESNGVQVVDEILEELEREDERRHGRGEPPSSTVTDAVDARGGAVTRSGDASGAAAYPDARRAALDPGSRRAQGTGARGAPERTRRGQLRPGAHVPQGDREGPAAHRPRRR